MVVAMKNFEVAKILKEIAIFLVMDDVPFKPRAYEKAATSIASMEEEVTAALLAEPLRHSPQNGVGNRASTRGTI